jgi:hypothetical protein
MFAEVVRSAEGRSLAGNIVAIHVSFSDDPDLFIALRERSASDETVRAQWQEAWFTDENDQPRSGRPALHLDLNGLFLLLRFAVEPDEPSEPVEALMHAERLLITFDHHYARGTKTEQVRVGVPLPEDPEHILAQALAWSRAQPRRTPRPATPQTAIPTGLSRLWRRLREALKR